MDPKDSIDHRNPEAITYAEFATNEATIFWKQMKYRCDFCNEGDAVTPEELKSGRGRSLSDSFDKALNPIDAVEEQTKSAMAKGLIALTSMDAKPKSSAEVSKARYGEEEQKAAGKLFVLDVKSLLQKDITLSKERLGRYRMWTNSLTQHDVILMPNATRLFSRGKLDYVSDVLTGDVFGDGRFYAVEIYSALNGNAVASPVIPIGSAGSLDFSNGTLTVPAWSDMELNLYEISGAWFLDNISAGKFSRLDADQQQINDYAMIDGAPMPEGKLVEMLTEDTTFSDGENSGLKRYWLGDTPETAADDAQTLIYLLYDPATDEIDAFRTSRAMMAAGEQDIDVSVAIYRDSKADRMGEEKYDLMFIDTPEGMDSEVIVITNVLQNREMEIPKPLRVVLRKLELPGADTAAYGLSGMLFAMEDATDGAVEMFEGDYTATFDGDVFDSAYTRIEGIADNDLKVTIKKDQDVWPEWTGENAAEDIQDYTFTRNEGIWAQDNPESRMRIEESPEGALAA